MFTKTSTRNSNRGVKSRLNVESLEAKNLFTTIIDFPDSPMPVPTEGITIDADGDLVVEYFDGFAGAKVGQFNASSGRAFGPHPVVDSGLEGAGRLETINNSETAQHLGVRTGSHLNLLPGGQVQWIQSDLANGGPLFHLKTTQTNNTNIYDVAGQRNNPGIIIIPASASYGDIAVHGTRDHADIFVSGISNGLPFVTRVRVAHRQIVSSRVILASSSNTVNSDFPRGVAVNNDGTVMTTLPVPRHLLRDGADQIVTWNADFPGRGINAPRFPFGVDGSSSVFSRGMTTDSQGNFVIATGSVGAVACNATGGVVVVDAMATNQSCLASLPRNPGTRDVAVRNDRHVYVTVSGPMFIADNEVQVFDYTPQPPAPNLVPLKPPAWDDGPIVVSTSRGDHSDANRITDQQEVFVDWSIFNGGGATQNIFAVALLLDGEKVGDIQFSALPSGGFASDIDVSLGKLDAGSHELTLLVDVTNSIRETHEGDNIFIRKFEVESESPGVLGDFNGDRIVNAKDIDQLFAAVNDGRQQSRYDLNGDRRVDQKDVDRLVNVVLKTDFGDSNLDGRFDSSDLVQIFQNGKFEDNVKANATWSDGDWNGDGEFDTSDLVFVFQRGGYVIS